MSAAGKVYDAKVVMVLKFGVDPDQARYVVELYDDMVKLPFTEEFTAMRREYREGDTLKVRLTMTIL